MNLTVPRRSTTRKVGDSQIVYSLKDGAVKVLTEGKIFKIDGRFISVECYTRTPLPNMPHIKLTTGSTIYRFHKATGYQLNFGRSDNWLSIGAESSKEFPNA